MGWREGVISCRLRSSVGGWRFEVWGERRGWDFNALEWGFWAGALGCAVVWRPAGAGAWMRGGAVGFTVFASLSGARVLRFRWEWCGAPWLRALAARAGLLRGSGAWDLGFQLASRASLGAGVLSVRQHLAMRLGGPSGGVVVAGSVSMACALPRRASLLPGRGVSSTMACARGRARV